MKNGTGPTQFRDTSRIHDGEGRGVAGTGASSRSPGMCVPREDRAFLRKASVQSRPPDRYRPVADLWFELDVCEFVSWVSRKDAKTPRGGRVGERSCLAGVAGTGASSRSPGMCVPREDRAFLRKASVQSRPSDVSAGLVPAGPATASYNASIFEAGLHPVRPSGSCDSLAKAINIRNGWQLTGVQKNRGRIHLRRGVTFDIVKRRTDDSWSQRKTQTPWHYQSTSG